MLCCTAQEIAQLCSRIVNYAQDYDSYRVKIIPIADSYRDNLEHNLSKLTAIGIILSLILSIIDRLRARAKFTTKIIDTILYIVIVFLS